jgi:hypothetical protein
MMGALLSIGTFQTSHNAQMSLVLMLLFRRSTTRAIEEAPPRRSTHRARSVSRRRVSEVEIRDPRGSYVDERAVRRSVSRVRY